MTATQPPSASTWVELTGDSCALPTVEKPVRMAEFDTLLTDRAVAVRRDSATSARILLRSDPQTLAGAADLAVRESACCSFFDFRLTVSGDSAELQVQVPPAYVPVLDALVGRVGSGPVGGRTSVPAGLPPGSRTALSAGEWDL